MRRFAPLAIILVVLVLAIGLGLFLRNSAKSRETSSESKAPALPNFPTTGAEPAHFKGAAVTRVTLEEFADFECPACGKFYPMLKQIEKEYGSRVKVIFRNFPLAQHVHAVPAARAAEAAGLQGKFWEMHDLLYENREAWTKASDVQPVMEEYARLLGLDMDKFKHDQKSEVVQQRITLDRYRGRAMKLKSTPTLYLNGEEIPFEQMKTIEELKKVLDKALNSGPRV